MVYSHFYSGPSFGLELVEWNGFGGRGEGKPNFRPIFGIKGKGREWRKVFAVVLSENLGKLHPRLLKESFAG